jgi:hypothetical protein
MSAFFVANSSQAGQGRVYFEKQQVKECYSYRPLELSIFLLNFEKK